MDGELLSYLYHRLLHSDSARVPPGCTYSDGVVALLFLYGALCDRSPRWAADPKHWPAWLRRVLPRPSYSQLTRRLKRPSVRELVDRLGTECRDRLPRPPGGEAERVVDGKPLVVGGYTKDPAGGPVPDGWAKGYKLHAVVDRPRGAVEAFEVTALDAGEPTVARRLVAGLDLAHVLLRGDANYDANPLYAAVADRGGRLLAPRKRPGTGLGHHRHHPDRLRAVAELERDEGHAGHLGEHRRHRIRVEQAFAHLTNLPCGLSPLPNFVRRLPRVQRWVAAKITLFHAYRMLLLQGKIAA
jgi:hypothetical protein